jgi:hypothetical protein
MLKFNLDQYISANSGANFQSGPRCSPEASSMRVVTYKILGGFFFREIDAVPRIFDAIFANDDWK